MKLKEYNLIKISLISFLLLFSIIYYLDSIHSPKLIQIKDIDKSYLNKFVKINVNIEKQIKKNQTLFLKLSDLKNKTSKINAIIFKTNITNLKKNENYTIIGKISFYKNKKEILINKILIKPYTQLMKS